MIFTATPLVQFKKVDHFLADLDAGHVVGVWHACFKIEDYLPRYRTIVRALVVDADGVVPTARIASFTYKHPILADEKGRVIDEGRVAEFSRREHERVVADLRERLAEISILEDKLRPGLLSVPSPYPYVDTDLYDFGGR